MQDAQLISQAGQVESLASDGLVSVSTGAGQPQKNMELAKFADSLGSSVPLQQTSEQVSITGLYARTSDGKMVELTKESVASVMAGLMDTNKLFAYNKYGSLTDFNNCNKSGVYQITSETASNGPTAQCWGVLNVVEGNNYIYQLYAGINIKGFYARTYENQKKEWSAWTRLDNFGYNTLAELSSGVAQQMKIESFDNIGTLQQKTYILNVYIGSVYIGKDVLGQYIIAQPDGTVLCESFVQSVNSEGYIAFGFENGLPIGTKYFFKVAVC